MKQNAPTSQTTEYECGYLDGVAATSIAARNPHILPDLPPRFRLLSPGCHVGGDGYLLINANSLTEHSSNWHSASDARTAAWDWWHDVRKQREAEA